MVRTHPEAPVVFSVVAAHKFVALVARVRFSQFQPALLVKWIKTIDYGSIMRGFKSYKAHQITAPLAKWRRHGPSKAALVGSNPTRSTNSK